MAAGLLQKADYLLERESKLSNQISTSARRANALVNDLLDLARCNLGTGIPVCLEVTNLSAVCESSVEELRTAFPTAQINFSNTREVIGNFDPSRIAQVFSNLISNALRHGDQRRPIQVSLSLEGNQSIFHVQNYGEAIPSHALPQLFTPGARYSSYANDEKGASAGLGLGLFIASQIVSGHGGKIEVQSTTESGTIFRVFLPINRPRWGRTGVVPG
jgi:signal transduction histidine kinase